MAALHIYSLDDENEDTIISIFSEGDHPIGRDKLNCKDKRVSRNHAVITVTKSDVALKSTHVNPTFYKSYGGNSIKIVKTNETVIIRDGDQFGLLADAFWFKVRFLKSSSGIKRLYNGTQVNKVLKISCEENFTNSNITKENECEKEIDSDKSLDFADVLDESNEQQNEIHIQDKPCVEDNENQLENNVTNKPCNVNNSDQNEIYIQDKPCVEDNENQLENNVTNKPCNVNNSDQNEIHIQDKSCVEDNENQLENNVTNKPYNVNNSNHTYQDIDKNKNICERKDFTDVSPGKSNEQEIKLFEPDKPLTENNNQLEESSINKPTCSNENVNMIDHICKDGDKNDTPMKNPKQKCWYGAKCYRKNVDHKQQYSHPGDCDYDENDIPDCPFGSGCYRTNILHRQQYKHTNAPAQKPLPNTNDSDDLEDSTNSNSTARKKRKIAAKVTKYAESPEDDYDLEDPFINDDSSDDFELSDNDDSDSDWQDSQEVEEESQERKRLLKEAKKFTYQKK